MKRTLQLLGILALFSALGICLVGFAPQQNQNNFNGNSVGGSNGQILYNNSGSSAGSSAFTFNSATGQVTANGFIVPSGSPGFQSLSLNGGLTIPLGNGSQTGAAVGNAVIFGDASYNFLHAVVNGIDAGQIATSQSISPLPSNTVALTADWTCGTGGTVSSCVAATIIGSGGGVPLTFTLPLVRQSYTLECDGVVGQATAATANNWNLLTAANGATNVTAFFDMYTAAGTKASGVTTDQASTTTTFNIGGTWTLGAAATKMPVHIWAKLEGVSPSGTVVSLQLVAPTVGDLVTLYRGFACRVF